MSERAGQQRVLTVGAGGGGAVVNLLLTVEASVAGGTLAVVAAVRVVGAAAVVEAGPVGTGHGALLAVLPIEAGGAGARERGLLVLQRAGRWD